MRPVQFNDPQCRRGDDPAHRCTDKYGDWFASPVRPARPGATCWWETMQRLEDERRLERALLRAYLADLDQLTTLEQAGIL